jgi:hypothetical protein
MSATDVSPAEIRRQHPPPGAAVAELRVGRVAVPQQGGLRVEDRAGEPAEHVRGISARLRSYRGPGE